MIERLYYISPRDVRKNRADPVSIMKSCHEFSRLGFDVTLVTPSVKRPENPATLDGLWDLYGMKPSFRILELPTDLTDHSSSLETRYEKLKHFTRFYRKTMQRPAVLYAKCYLSLLPALLMKKTGLLGPDIKTIFDTAIYRERRWSHKFNARNVDGIVLFNDFIQDKYVKIYGVEPSRIFKAGFPSQWDSYAPIAQRSKWETRQALGLSQSDRIVMYAGKATGHMKEIQYFLKAASILPDVTFAVVGISKNNRAWFDDYLEKTGLSNILLFEFQPLERLYAFVRSADVLVSYYDASDDVSVNQRVPGKSTIYLCTGNPVVFADLPSLREWFSDDIVFFAPPNDPEALAATIERLFADETEASEKASRARQFAQQNTYRTSFDGIARFARTLAS